MHGWFRTWQPLSGKRRTFSGGSTMNQTMTAPLMYAGGKTTEDYKAKSITNRNVSIGYLRAFVTLLVLAHHSVLAYHPYAPTPAQSLVVQPRLWQAFPVVDSRHWTPFSMLVGFNELFFMSLMFLLSGLFVWKSLEHKGGPTFLRDRLIRLGLPFIVAAGLVAPIAYYPAYLQTGASSGIAGFWHQWISLGNWPAGPAWFIWLLLAFDCVAVLLFALMPRWGEAVGRLSSNVARRPFAFFGL